jgi:hypothetical protein
LQAFSIAVKDRFDTNKSPELLEAYRYFLSRPPKIQALVNDRLSWKENQKRDDESEFTWVVRSIGVVRNNLFHGGKFPWDQARATDLLSYGFIILYECLELDEAVYKAFNYSP